MFKKYNNKKNLKKSLWLKNPNYLKNIFVSKKKYSWVLNIRTTRFNQSYSVQPNPEKTNQEKSQKSLKNLFERIVFCWGKKCYTLCFSILGGRDLTRALQYSPFSEFRGVAWSWRSKNRSRSSRTVLPLSNIGLLVKKTRKSPKNIKDFFLMLKKKKKMLYF